MPPRDEDIRREMRANRKRKLPFDEAYIRENEQRPCDIPQCWETRHKSYRLCTRHSRAYSANGSPMLPRLRAQDYRSIQRRVHSLLRRNEEHAMLMISEREIAHLIASAHYDGKPRHRYSSAKSRSQKLLSLMRTHDVPAREITETYLACALYYATTDIGHLGVYDTRYTRTQIGKRIALRVVKHMKDAGLRPFLAKVMKGANNYCAISSLLDPILMPVATSSLVALRAEDQDEAKWHTDLNKPFKAAQIVRRTKARWAAMEDQDNTESNTNE